jgi:hypothetical protein
LYQTGPSADGWQKYTGQKEEKGHLLYWIRQAGYDIPPKHGKFAGQTPKNMTKSVPASVSTLGNENVQLKEKIASVS